MKSDSRLARVERNLSPRQLVTMGVVESRRQHRSFIEYGQATARAGMPRPTLMDRIAASVTATSHGADRMLRNSLIRKAQREGLFLARLSNEVAAQVVEEETELGLKTALVAAHLGLMLGLKMDLPESDLQVWLDGAVRHRRRLLCLKAAVGRIEEAYFDGVTLLFPDTAECLSENLTRIESILSMAVGPREGLPPEDAGMNFRELGPTPAEVDRDAENTATAWVINVQGSVAAEFGEDDHAVRLLASILLKDG
jgi:hypothetical protein